MRSANRFSAAASSLHGPSVEPFSTLICEVNTAQLISSPIDGSQSLAISLSTSTWPSQSLNTSIYVVESIVLQKSLPWSVLVTVLVILLVADEVSVLVAVVSF